MPQKPSASAVLFRDHRLSRGLVRCVPLLAGVGAPRETLKDTPVTQTNTPTWVSTPYGAGRNYVAASTQKDETPWPEADGASNLSYAVLTFRAATTDASFAGRNDSNTARMHLNWFNDTFLYVAMNNGADSSARVVYNTTGWHVFLFTFDGTQTGDANRLKLYIDGVAQTLSFVASAIPATAPTLTSGMYMSTGAGSCRFAGEWAWNRTLQPEEAVAHARDPFGMFDVPWIRQQVVYGVAPLSLTSSIATNLVPLDGTLAAAVDGVVGADWIAVNSLNPVTTVVTYINGRLVPTDALVSLGGGSKRARTSSGPLLPGAMNVIRQVSTTQDGHADEKIWYATARRVYGLPLLGDFGILAHGISTGAAILADYATLSRPNVAMLTDMAVPARGILAGTPIQTDYAATENALGILKGTPIQTDVLAVIERNEPAGAIGADIASFDNTPFTVGAKVLATGYDTLDVGAALNTTAKEPALAFGADVVGPKNEPALRIGAEIVSPERNFFRIAALIDVQFARLLAEVFVRSTALQTIEEDEG